MGCLKSKPTYSYNYGHGEEYTIITRLSDRQKTLSSTQISKVQSFNLVENVKCKPIL
jgi:hypothetical protein